MLFVRLTAFHEQISRYPVKFTFGNHQARVSLSVELISGSYSSTYPGFEQSFSNWKTHVTAVPSDFIWNNTSIPYTGSV